MAAQKTTAKKQTLPEDEKALQVKLTELRTELLDQTRSIKSGTATNVRVARKTRKEIAQILTKLNKLNKEGERS